SGARDGAAGAPPGAAWLPTLDPRGVPGISRLGAAGQDRVRRTPGADRLRRPADRRGVGVHRRRRTVHRRALVRRAKEAEEGSRDVNTWQSARPAVVAVDVYKAYGAVRAVDGVSFTVARGEFFGLIGPNGAGKTTLIEILEGLRRPDKGEAEVLGLSPWPRNLALLPRIGLQTQN